MATYQRIRQRLISDASFHQNRYAELLGSVVHPGIRWLDIGAGTKLHHGWVGPSNEKLANTADVVLGCDLLPDHLRRNRYLTDRIVAAAERLPVGDSTIDIVTANMLLEHLEELEPVVREVGRVLKSGGRFVFVTPNLLHPPIFLSKALISANLRRRLAHHLDGRNPEHIFPTFYRGNTLRKLRRLCLRWGLDVEILSAFFSHPFVRWPPLATIAEAVAIRLTPSPLARRLGSNILGCMVKR